MPDFLLEIGTEEIPARMIDGAQAEFVRRVEDLLARERLADKVDVTPLSTPRRLAVLMRGVRGTQPDLEEGDTRARSQYCGEKSQSRGGICEEGRRAVRPTPHR